MSTCGRDAKELSAIEHFPRLTFVLMGRLTRPRNLLIEKLNLIDGFVVYNDNAVRMLPLNDISPRRTKENKKAITKLLQISYLTSIYGSRVE